MLNVVERGPFAVTLGAREGVRSWKVSARSGIRPWRDISLSDGWEVSRRALISNTDIKWKKKRSGRKGHCSSRWLRSNIKVHLFDSAWGMCAKNTTNEFWWAKTKKIFRGWRSWFIFKYIFYSSFVLLPFSVRQPVETNRTGTSGNGHFFQNYKAGIALNGFKSFVTSDPSCVGREGSPQFPSPSSGGGQHVKHPRKPRCPRWSVFSGPKY